MERDDGVVQQRHRTGQDDAYAIRVGRQWNLGFDLGELGRTNQWRRQRIVVHGSAEVLRNGGERNRVHWNGERGRVGHRLDDGLDECERGRWGIVPGAAADWSQDRRSASVKTWAEAVGSSRQRLHRYDSEKSL